MSALRVQPVPLADATHGPCVAVHPDLPGRVVLEVPITGSELLRLADEALAREASGVACVVLFPYSPIFARSLGRALGDAATAVEIAERGQRAGGQRRAG